MRDRVYRLISAGIFGLMVWAVVRVVTGGLDFAPDLDDVWTVVGGLVLAPTFAVYALKGNDAAMKVLLPGLALLNLPQILLDKLARRAEVPAELEAGDEPAAPPDEAPPERAEP